MLDPNMKLITNVEMLFDVDAPGVVSWHYANDGKMFAWTDVANICGGHVVHEAGDNNYHRTLIVHLVSTHIAIKYRDNQASPLTTHSAFRDLELLQEEVLAARNRG